MKTDKLRDGQRLIATRYRVSEETRVDLWGWHETQREGGRQEGAGGGGGGLIHDDNPGNVFERACLTRV